MSPEPQPRLLRPWAAALVIAAAMALAYSNTLHAPFLYDDNWNIIKNPCVHGLWPIWKVFSGCPSGISGRPLAALSFALNYAVGGESPAGYHAVNISIHILAALTLFGIVRRTFRDYLGWRPRESLAAAAGSALLWGLHPLCTQAVTYITQRIESLMGLLFLLTLYLAIRGWRSSRPWLWHAGAAAAFVTAVGVKEVIVAAPVMVLLYDWMFNHRGAKSAAARSPLLYGGFVAGWVLLALLVSTGATAKTAHLQSEAVSSWQYAMVQPMVIAHYLKLAVWPSSLCFDYGFLGDAAHPWAGAGLGRIIPAAVFLIILAAASLRLIWRRNPAGFVGAWFFAILSPTSSIVPLYIPAEEHRMYLPLAGLAVLAAGGAAAWVRSREGAAGTRLASLMACLGVAACLALGGAAYERNKTYQSRISLWSDTLLKGPGNSQAALNLGSALVDAGRPAEGAAFYRLALKRQSKNPQLHENLAVALASLGESGEASFHYETALVLDPNRPKSHCNLGAILARAGALDEAIAHFQQAAALDPEYVDALNNLGYAHLLKGDYTQARTMFLKALTLAPGSPYVLANLRALEEAEKKAGRAGD